MLSRLVNIRSRHKIQILPNRYFYDSRSKNDTIFAPSTSIDLTKGSPLGVIRVSGSKTRQVLQQLTNYNVSVQKGDTLNSVQPDTDGKKQIKARQATLAKIIRRDTRELIDMGLVLWFPKPNSYTGEDVCEFHLHGSQAVMKNMLDYLGTFQGLRPAEAGEFTRRAVLNNKMTLLQAESLPDLIGSKTDYQRKLALKGLNGETLDRYSSWISCLVDILAHLEASIDFGEDELIGEQAVVQNCVLKIEQLSREIDTFIKIGTHCREIIQTGVRAVILGKPNSGKSTFMNLLCRRDRSIVSDLSGTTRDVVEHCFELGGHAITLCDTAGLKDISLGSPLETSQSTLLEKHDSIEREGIKRAIDAAKDAHLIFYLIDGTKYSGDEKDKTNIVKELEDVLLVLGPNNKVPRMLYLVINKMDLNDKFINDQLTSLDEFKFNTSHEMVTSFISCRSKLNLDKLVDQLSNQLDKYAKGYLESALDDERLSPEGDRQTQHDSQQLDYVNERHLSLLISTHRHLFKASKLNLTTIDKMAQHVRESVDYLSRIVGSVSNDEVIDVIFRDFCIGK